MFRMNSKIFLRILLVLKVGALEEAQSIAQNPNKKKATPSREQLFI
jgi:hypothetical protein